MKDASIGCVCEMTEASNQLKHPWQLAPGKLCFPYHLGCYVLLMSIEGKTCTTCSYIICSC